VVQQLTDEEDDVDVLIIVEMMLIIIDDEDDELDVQIIRIVLHLCDEQDINEW
jgi:hypothetical protein